ncbi:MAG TPA: cytidine deaminase [Candidatus Dormibacteraeota bacterium]|nr:cytidine deaminase [Candidatus Dormibacteraeota bacterium]
MNPNQYEALIAAARQARENAHAPYSNFRVGAAVRAKSGRIYSGCNVENASYGLTCCAERVAIFKAVSEGERGFDAIAVVTDAEKLTPPCGACRQIIWEFCGDVPVILADLAGNSEKMSAAELLPRAFDSNSISEA